MLQMEAILSGDFGEKLYGWIRCRYSLLRTVFDRGGVRPVRGTPLYNLNRRRPSTKLYTNSTRQVFRRSSFDGETTLVQLVAVKRDWMRVPNLNFAVLAKGGVKLVVHMSVLSLRVFLMTWRSWQLLRAGARPRHRLKPSSVIFRRLTPEGF